MFLRKKTKNTQSRTAGMKKHLKRLHLHQYIDRSSFDKLAKKWMIDKGVIGLSTWQLTCSLIGSFVLGLRNFREIERTFSIPRSTLSDALSSRSYGFFEELCDQVINQIHKSSAPRNLRTAIREILAIDSSEFRVHGSLFSLTGWKQKFSRLRTASGKLHVVWNVGGDWVEDFLVTAGRKGDSPVSLLFRLLPGKVYVFDRAYNDLSFWYQIMIHGSDFVTRLKNVPRNRYKKLIAEAKKSKRCRVLFDGIYRPTSLANHPQVPRDIEFRHVIYRDLESGKVFHFVTSDFKSSATTIAETYRKRWAVELLFKWLKGHLKIRHLNVKSPNAIKVQIAVAILVQLLLKLKQVIDQCEGSQWDIMSSVRSVLLCEGLNNTGFWEVLSVKPLTKARIGF